MPGARGSCAAGSRPGEVGRHLGHFLFLTWGVGRGSESSSAVRGLRLRPQLSSLRASYSLTLLRHVRWVTVQAPEGEGGVFLPQFPPSKQGWRPRHPTPRMPAAHPRPWPPSPRPAAAPSPAAAVAAHAGGVAVAAPWPAGARTPSPPGHARRPPAGHRRGIRAAPAASPARSLRGRLIAVPRARATACTCPHFPAPQTSPTTVHLKPSRAPSCRVRALLCGSASARL